MTAEVISFQQFLKVIRQSNRVKFHSVVSELLDPRRMHIAVNEAVGMKKLKAQQNLVQSAQNFRGGHSALGKSFPLL